MTTALLESSQRTNALLEQIAALLAGGMSGKSSLENDFPDFSNPTPVPLPSKMELAIRWLSDHEEDRTLTGRELSQMRRPEGVTISHKTWNDAKRML